MHDVPERFTCLKQRAEPTESKPKPLVVHDVLHASATGRRILWWVEAQCTKVDTVPYSVEIRTLHVGK